jgi:hypothetical protein
VGYFKVPTGFVDPTGSGAVDNPAVSTEKTVSFTVKVMEACTTITTFEPGRTIGPD